MCAGARVTARLQQRGDDRDREDDDDHEQRRRGGDLRDVVVLEMGPVQQELDADECQDQREAGGQVDEPVQEAGDEEVQGAQAQQCERVGGEDDERLPVTPKTVRPSS